MAALRLFNLLALASIAIVTLSSVPVRVNALVADRAQVVRHVQHDAIARRKRSDSPPSASGRCKPRPSSSIASPLPTSPPTSTTPTTPTTPPTPATSSTAPSPTSTGSSLSGGQKQWGLAWPNGDQWLGNFALPNVGYLYTWSPELPDLSNFPNIQGMIMLHDASQAQDFQQKAVQGYAKYALGFNEPDIPSQANLTPQQAVDLWWQYINPLKDLGYTLISPACVDDDNGLQWYQQFFQLCNGCTVDAIAFHAYTVNAADLINFANTLYNTYHLPVFITEFADQNFSGQGGQPDMNQVWDFAGQVVGFVNQTPWVTAFPWGAMTDLQGVDANNALMDSNGNPNALAYYYLG